MPPFSTMQDIWGRASWWSGWVCLLQDKYTAPQIQMLLFILLHWITSLPWRLSVVFSLRALGDVSPSLFLWCQLPSTYLLIHGQGHNPLPTCLEGKTPCPILAPRSPLVGKLIFMLGRAVVEYSPTHSYWWKALQFGDHPVSLHLKCFPSSQGFLGFPDVST